MHKMFFNNTNKKTNFIQSTIYASDSYPKHPYHLVTPSPCPFLGGLAALTLTTGGVMFMHAFAAGKLALFFGQVML